MGTPRGRSSWTTSSASCRSEVRRALPPWARGRGQACQSGREFSMAGGIQELSAGERRQLLPRVSGGRGALPRMGGSRPYCRDPGYDGSWAGLPGGRGGQAPGLREAPWSCPGPFCILGTSVLHPIYKTGHTVPTVGSAQIMLRAGPRVLSASRMPARQLCSPSPPSPVYGVAVADQGLTRRCLGVGNSDGTGGWCGWGHRGPDTGGCRSLGASQAQRGWGSARGPQRSPCMGLAPNLEVPQGRGRSVCGVPIAGRGSGPGQPSGGSLGPTGASATEGGRNGAAGATRGPSQGPALPPCPGPCRPLPPSLSFCKHRPSLGWPEGPRAGDERGVNPSCAGPGECRPRSGPGPLPCYRPAQPGLLPPKWPERSLAPLYRPVHTRLSPYSTPCPGAQPHGPWPTHLAPDQALRVQGC